MVILRPLPLRVVLLLVGFVTGLATTIAAQEPKPAFEVASVKRSLSAQSDWNQSIRPGGRYVANNAALVYVIQYAYGVPDFQLENVPSWVKTERFDITARAERDVPAAQIQPMLQTLLEDRFRLVVRRETRDMPVSTLVLARSDGRVGPSLVKVSGQDECEGAAVTRQDAPSGALTIGGCGPLSGIAGLAGRHMETTVVDGTGLTGTFKFTMHYAADLQATGTTSLPSFVTALNEQLGLRLRPGRGPVEVVVIESVERPSEN